MEEKSMETGKDPPPAAAAGSTEPHNGSSSMLTTSSMVAAADAAASLASVVVANGLPTTAVEITLAQPNSSFKKLDCTAATEEAAAGQAAARSVGDEEDLLPKKKRAKTSHEWVQTVLRQTAEMVMVLAGMGALRAGLSPTPLECKLATEAYEKLASLVENVAPLQLVSKDAVSSLIQQLRVDVAPVAPQQPKTLKPFVIKPPTVQAADRNAPDLGATKSIIPQDPASKDGDKQVSHTVKGQGKPPNLQPSQLPKEGPTLPSPEKQGTHQQLAMGIQLLIKQRSVPMSSALISNAYQSPPVACGVCKLVAHDTSSVLVCDGCESAFHVACLQLLNPRVIPKSDWYCPKCVIASGGRPQAPKYGPLRRGHGSQGSTRGSWGLPGGKSNEASIGQMAGKSVVLQKTKEIGAEVMQSVKEPVGIRSLNSALDSTKTTAAAEKESKLVLLEQRSGDGSAGSQMKVFSTPPGTHVNTQTASRVTSTLEEAVILSVEIPGTPKTSAGTADVMTKEATIIEAAPAVAVTIPPPPAEEETATGGKDVTGKDSLVEWVGSVVNISQGNVYYAACSVAGVTMRLQDCALFRPESPQDPPYIARLQALWEEKSTGAKWVKVNWCYYPSDLPMETGRPASENENEVYESNHSDNNLVGSIHGPCQVLPPLQYQQEIERRAKGTSEGLPPIFLCRWFYDAPRGVFRACSQGPSN
ncbi:hypothetical protein CY35_11G037900 [Sphagnum magellanicum]|nr:hypothetical protein CY35_11G037900 [Sphagnum magellanicum]KAH9547521.1 hypothetical protein CY35_11G037900 [Sphagnum magellanicum]